MQINNLNSDTNKNAKLHSLILIIAKEVKRICEENNIPYFIFGGTLLGSVRHQGFIPWDDDFDFLMRRSDYERFIEICKYELDLEKFFLQTETSELNYAFSFAKIQLLDTEIIEDFSKNVPIHHGIFVDIFPFDNIPDNQKQRKKLLYKNHLLKNMLWVKCGYGTDKHKKKLSYWIFKFLSYPFSIEWLKQKRYHLITKYNNVVSKENFISDYPDVLRLNSWFNNIKKYKFEDTEFDSIVEADVYLTQGYGDYMQLPPVEERISHSYHEINYGPY